MHRNSTPISVVNAEISTVSVEIQTLTIGRKQVTLAVFRQLQEDDLISSGGYGLDPDGVYRPWPGELNGTPWGRVNYCPGEKHCYGAQVGLVRDEGPHEHIVWQDGSELRRASVSTLAPRSVWDDLVGATAWLWLGLRLGVPLASGHESSQDLRRRFPEWDLHPSRDPSRRTLVGSYGNKLGGSIVYDGIPNLAFAKAAENACIKLEGLTADVVEAHLRERLAERAKLDRQYRELVAQLQALPQLFIAV